jgi:hypothetical protein
LRVDKDRMLILAVMKKIAAMPNIPKNDELKITDRAQKLMNDVSAFPASTIAAAFPGMSKMGFG